MRGALFENTRHRIRGHSGSECSNVPQTSEQKPLLLALLLGHRHVLRVLVVERLRMLFLRDPLDPSLLFVILQPPHPQVSAATLHALATVAYVSPCLPHARAP